MLHAVVAPHIGREQAPGSHQAFVGGAPGAMGEPGPQPWPHPAGLGREAQQHEVVGARPCRRFGDHAGRRDGALHPRSVGVNDPRPKEGNTASPTTRHPPRARSGTKSYPIAEPGAQVRIVPAPRATSPGPVGRSPFTIVGKSDPFKLSIPTAGTVLPVERHVVTVCPPADAGHTGKMVFDGHHLSTRHG